ncbi:hypothetical protein ACHQM5_008230 [Ranunculus cassubicifolius]
MEIIENSFDLQYSHYIREALDELSDNFTITDPTINGHPIVFASKGFLKMSGYSKKEVVGKNGRIFQGPKTDRRSVMEIREAIREERRVQVPIGPRSRGGGRVGGCGLSEDGDGFPDIVFGSCRREVCNDSVVELGRVRVRNTAVDLENRGYDAEETCEASDMDKQKAAKAVNNILSLLSHYSERTGRLVCGKRCCSVVIKPLGSSLTISLGRIKQSFVLFDAKVDEMPIVYASDAFLKMTGYTRHEVFGNNSRFLDGPDTDIKVICELKDCIRSECACSVRILNYRKDGCKFWNLLHISPIRNSSGKIAFYAGVQIEEGCENGINNGLSPEMRQLAAVGAIKVAVRCSSMSAGSSIS